MKVETSRERTEYQRGGDVVIQTHRRWLRLAVYYGTPPGSHIGFWQTRWGQLRGWNVRVGKRYVGPCVTAFVHTERRRPA